MNGKAYGSETAAIIALSKVIGRFTVFTSTSIVIAPVNLPYPCTCLLAHFWHASKAFSQLFYDTVFSNKRIFVQARLVPESGRHAVG